MDLEEKIELNKIVRKYAGGNIFILSLQNQLKISKTLTKVEQGKRKIKILSDKQYDAVKGILNV